MTGATWSISYGDGSSANGTVYTDTVSVGTAVASNQAVELAENVSDQFLSDNANDGLLGLAFDSLNTSKSGYFQFAAVIRCAASLLARLTCFTVSPTPQKTFFSTVKKSLDAPLFTADLKAGAPGSYDFGFIDNTKYSGNITYVAVDNSQGFWGCSSTAYGIGGDGTNLTQKNIDTIVDTGTTLLLLPDDILTEYYAQVSSSTNDPSNGWSFPCDATLPDFFIGFNNYTAKVPGSAINFSPLSGTSKWHSRYDIQCC